MSRLVITLDAQALEERLQWSCSACRWVGWCQHEFSVGGAQRANLSSNLKCTKALIETQQGEARIYHHGFGLMGSLW